MAEEPDAAASSKAWRVRLARRRAGAPFLSPAVRHVVAEHGLDPAQVIGTGAGARVTRADAVAAARAIAVLPREGHAEADELERFTPIRRTTAVHVLRAKAAAPHAHVAVACDYGAVQRARLESGLTYLPFVARAVVDSLRAFPYCNASSGGDDVIVHRAVHLGIAVDLDFEGLIVPVIRDADGKRLRALSDGIVGVATRARTRRLAPEDVSGGTFTITNPGPFGTFLSMPIINHPQVAILATDAVRKRLVVTEGRDGTDVLAIRPIGMLALGFDSRVVDGAYAAAFVQRVAEIVETRDWSNEL
jgi:pyruvate dehydrogenase E2 component (dihydrolipoamide acetyltransferase)